MSVFRNYDASKAGNVNANAFPRVHTIPWTPTQRNVRSNPNIPSQPQRIQPHERGTFFDTSANNGGTLAAQMSSGCGCGGGCTSGGSGVSGIASTPPSASSTATENVMPVSSTIARPRVMPRMTGALRATSTPARTGVNGLRNSTMSGSISGRR